MPKIRSIASGVIRVVWNKGPIMDHYMPGGFTFFSFSYRQNKAKSVFVCAKYAKTVRSNKSIMEVQKCVNFLNAVQWSTIRVHTVLKMFPNLENWTFGQTVAVNWGFYLLFRITEKAFNENYSKLMNKHSKLIRSFFAYLTCELKRKCVFSLFLDGIRPSTQRHLSLPVFKGIINFHAPQITRVITWKCGF